MKKYLVNNKKRILFLTNMYPSHSNPSYGVFVKKTYDWLVEKYDVKLIKITKHNCLGIKLMAYLFFSFSAIVRGILGQYDCVYAHYISHSAIPVKIIKFVKKDIIIVGNVHGEDVFANQKKFEKNPKRAKIFLESADYIIAPSEYYKNRLYQEYGYNLDSIFVSPSGGVDMKMFIPSDKMKSKQKLNLLPNVKYIGYVSRIEKGKGWDVFLRAAGELCRNPQFDNFKFVVVGSGGQNKELEDNIDDLNIRDRIVRFPLLSQDKLRYVFNALEIFCFTTCLENESLGLVGIEALSCGTLSVLSDVPGVSTYAKDEINCILYQHDSAEKLRKMIQKLEFMSESQKNVMKINARKSVEEYNAETVKERYYQFFHKILNSR